MMPKPRADKAPAPVGLHDRFYMGSFGRDSRFDVGADSGGFHVWLERLGDERRKVGLHLDYLLLASLLDAMADTIESGVTVSKAQRRHLVAAVGRLRTALSESSQEPGVNRKQ